MTKPTFLLMALWLTLTTTWAQTDATSSIVNPNFDGRSFAGWQQQGMWVQNNNSFSQKNNYAYAERWVASTGNLPDTYIHQRLTGLTPGRYTLTVAAQHIKQGSSTDATGGVVFADWEETPVTTATDYSLDFYVLTGDVTIGFRCTNSTANWMACDNWRLTLTSSTDANLRTGLSALISKANALASQSMSNDVLGNLQTSISAAQRLTSTGTSSSITPAATTLKTAMLAAERSIFATKTSTSGNVPTVSTDTRYARGATMIFGRSTVNSSANLLEEGFCYSTSNAEPTVSDERTTRYVENNGRIYCLDNLQPGTFYYIRAYAVTTDYKVGYGQVLRVSTLPMGNVTWSHDNAGSDIENQRIGQSIMGAAHYWSILTSIKGFSPSSHYSSGTPTADCSYGGWIRVGSKEDYQATGTLMHEMGHGIGVGTHSTYSGDIRTDNTSGQWRGKRATRFLQFWDNSEDVRLTGDKTHLWATNVKSSLSYTINGAQEDAHSDASYYGNSLLMQAIVEDGLAPVGGNLQGLAYTLDTQDGQPFLIRCSDDDFGLRTSFLVDNGGTLQLKKLTTDEAMTPTMAALWLMEFQPATQTYRIRNQQTGRYIYYAADNTSNGFRTTTSTSSEIDLRLQLSFADVTIGLSGSTMNLDCYHIMRATSTPSPQALCAMSTTVTGSQPFSNTFAATPQRWIIIPADQMQKIQQIMDLDQAPDLGYNITTAMAPYLCTGSLKNWTNDGMKVNYLDGGAPYINPSDGARIDFPFIERWVSTTNGTLPDTKIEQTINELPSGYYYLRGSFIACTQTDADIVISGVKFYAGDQSVDIATGNGTPKRYALRVKVTDGTLTFGLNIKSTPANWVAMDNLQLFYDGTEEEYLSLATPCHPVRVPMINTTFDQWKTDGWELSDNWSLNYNNGAEHELFNWPYAEWWVNAAAQADRSMSQTLTLRAGYYTLDAAVEATRQDQPELEVSGVTLRFDDEQIVCHTANKAPQWFSVGKTVEAGEHRIGLYVQSTDANWVAVDNYVLRYYGPHKLLQGDINADGQVTIADVTALVNIILGKNDQQTDTCTADINADGQVTIADVTALVNIILGK